MGIVKKLEAKTERIRQKETKEIQKWTDAKAEYRPRFYIFYLIAILCLAFIVDEIASNINTSFQNNVLKDFFVDFFSLSTSEALNAYTLVVTLCTGISVFTFLYRTLADKFGRKVFLVINLFGMAIGLFICSLANNPYLYFGGLIFIFFFIPNDIQLIYILESAPPKRRTLFVFISKAFATLSLALISFLRNFTMIEGNWRTTFLYPAIFGLLVAVLALLFVEETPAFMDSRIKFLTDDLKPHKRRTKAKKVINAQGGFISAIKYSFMYKPLLWIMLVGLLFSICSIGLANYSEIAQSHSFSTEGITNILFYFPLSGGAIILILGLVCEFIGRKVSASCSGILCFIAIVVFYLGCRLHFSTLIIGISLGVFIGSYTALLDTYNIIISESSPTNLRASILSVSGISVSVGNFIGTALLILFNSIITNPDLGLIILLIIAPSTGFASFVLIKKVKETKNVDLEQVMIIETKKKKSKQIKD